MILKRMVFIHSMPCPHSVRKFATQNMTGRRFHRTMEMIPARPWQSKSPSFSTPVKQSRKQGNARGTSEVRRGTSSNHFHCRVPRSSSHIGPPKNAIFFTDFCFIASPSPNSVPMLPVTRNCLQWGKSNLAGCAEWQKLVCCTGVLGGVGRSFLGQRRRVR